MFVNQYYKAADNWLKDKDVSINTLDKWVDADGDYHLHFITGQKVRNKDYKLKCNAELIHLPTGKVYMVTPNPDEIVALFYNSFPNRHVPDNGASLSTIPITTTKPSKNGSWRWANAKFDRSMIIDCCEFGGGRIDYEWYVRYSDQSLNVYGADKQLAYKTGDGTFTIDPTSPFGYSNTHMNQSNTPYIIANGIELWFNVINANGYFVSNFGRVNHQTKGLLFGGRATFRTDVSLMIDPNGNRDKGVHPVCDLINYNVPRNFIPPAIIRRLDKETRDDYLVKNNSTLYRLEKKERKKFTLDE
jgi:hypothetical protein